MIVVVGEKVRFNPTKCMSAKTDAFEQGKDVVGEIIEVNYNHKWFLVEYGCPALRISFKFCDIGELVKVYGH